MFTRVITADKAGFLEHLDKVTEEHRKAQLDAVTEIGRRYEAGVMTGLRIARRAVEDWELDA